jgi:hypothetical protein
MPLASDGFGLALGPPSRRSTTPDFERLCAIASAPRGGRNGFSHGPLSDDDISQPSNTWMK